MISSITTHAVVRGVMRTRQARGTNTAAACATLDITGACGCVQISTLIACGAPRVAVVWACGTNGSRAVGAIASLLATCAINCICSWTFFVLADTTNGLCVASFGFFDKHVRQDVTAGLAHD